MKEAKFNGFAVRLVETDDDLHYFRSELNKKVKIGFDTETTGLSFIKDRIVGYCFSTGKSYHPKDYAGYYIPIRHVDYENNFDPEIIADLAQEILDNYQTVAHNRNFDAFMAENEGIKIPFVGGMHDSQQMCHLVNGDNMPALKLFAKDYLKWDMIDYVGGSFGDTDPRQSFIYAAGDPITTVMLARHLWATYPYIRKIYPIDNKSIEAVRRLSKAPLFLNKAVIEREMRIASQKLAENKAKVFAITGYEFNLNSSRDKADALSRFVTLTAKTKTGKFAVNEEALLKVDHPLAEMFITHAQTQKYISSYLQKMLDFPNPFRCSYSTCNVPTGRLSSGGSKNNDYFASFNIQNVPKEEEMKFVHNDPVLGHIVNNVEEGSIGTVKCKAGLREAFVPPEGYIWMSFDYSGQEMCVAWNTKIQTPEGTRLIKALSVGDKVLTPNGYKRVSVIKATGRKPMCKLTLKTGEEIICSEDHQFRVLKGFRFVWRSFQELKYTDVVLTHSGKFWSRFYQIQGISNVKKLEWLQLSEEMYDITVEDAHCYYANGILTHNCLMANFSRDPVLVNCVRDGKDIHNYIAKHMFGYEDPKHRTKVKILNFAVNYGGSEHTIARKLSIPTPEAKKLLDLYNTTLRKLTEWKEIQKQTARRKGMVFTYFGRPRVLFKYYNKSDNGIKAFADRSAINSPVQGCLPLESYLEVKDSVIPFSKALGQRLLRQDGKPIVPVAKGQNEPLLVRFRTGDFIICDFNHQFISGTKELPFVEKLRDGIPNKVLLSPLLKKVRPAFRGLFKGIHKSLVFLKIQLQSEDTIRNNNRYIAAAFWTLAIARYKFSLNYKEMTRIRSLGSIYGFNIVTNKKAELFQVKFHRKRKCRIHFIQALKNEGELVPVGSCTVLDGRQMYPSQGFYNKNTGGDLIRIAISKVMNQLDKDPEFKENVIPNNTVHDEINFYVKPKYMYKAYKKITAMMEFFPENFEVPLKVSCAAGTDWGSAPDVVRITEGNKIVLIDDN